jgi:hypothetical protein
MGLVHKQLTCKYIIGQAPPRYVYSENPNLNYIQVSCPDHQKKKKRKKKISKDKSQPSRETQSHIQSFIQTCPVPDEFAQVLNAMASSGNSKNTSGDQAYGREACQSREEGESFQRP